MAQTVLVTGASGGVGRAVAQRFRADGAIVIAGYRDASAREELAATGCRPVRLDVTEESEVVTATRGEIDIVVNAASVVGQVTMPGMGAYAMSKRGLESMSEALRQELKAFGIRVSVIQPGGIETPFAETERRIFRQSRPDGPYAGFTAEVVDGLGRNPVALHPERVARVVHRAATARHPRTHYRVGGLAHAMLDLHRTLPSRVWDRLVPMITPTPAA